MRDALTTIFYGTPGLVTVIVGETTSGKRDSEKTGVKVTVVVIKGTGGNISDISSVAVGIKVGINNGAKVGVSMATVDFKVGSIDGVGVGISMVSVKTLNLLI